jgi:hypothetical protein
MNDKEWKEALDHFERKLRGLAGVDGTLVGRARAALDAAGHDVNTGLVLLMAQQLLVGAGERARKRAERS